MARRKRYSAEFKRQAMKMYSKSLQVISAISLMSAIAVPAIAQEENSADRLIGAWKIVQTVSSNPSGERVDVKPPPGMYMFTDRYMSNLIVPEREPRPVITSDSSDEDKLGAFGNFIADGGEYWVEGDVIQTHNFVAKVPNAMRSDRKRGEGIRYRFHFEEDDLVIIMTNQGWAQSGSITYRLQRMK
jgi:hypothetical protein